jgi:thiamine pyrophosphate-dependent acetolactate synthase large subunit-like protein
MRSKNQSRKARSGVLSNQTPVAGGSGFGLGLGIASPQAYPIRRVIRIGGIGGIAISLNIPLSVALDHADIANLRGAVIEHVCISPHRRHHRLP